MSAYIRIRIKATGQVIDMVPAGAFPLLDAGMAERIEPQQPESATVIPISERADAAPQTGPARKPFRRGK
jgi:hypothetical protein